MPLLISPIPTDSVVASGTSQWGEVAAASQMPVLTIPQLIDLMLLSAEKAHVAQTALDIQLCNSHLFDGQLGALAAQYSPDTFLQLQCNSFATNFELKYNEIMVQVQALFQEMFKSQQALSSFVMSENLAGMPKADLEVLQSKFPATFNNLNRLTTYMKLIEHYIGLPPPQQITVKANSGEKTMPITAYYTPMQYPDLLFKMGIQNMCFLGVRIKELSDAFKQVNPARLNLVSGVAGADEKPSYAGYIEFEEKDQYKSYQSLLDYWVPQIKKLFNYPVDDDEQRFVNYIDHAQQQLQQEAEEEAAAEAAQAALKAQSAATTAAKKPFKFLEEIKQKLTNLKERRDGNTDAAGHNDRTGLIVQINDITQAIQSFNTELDAIKNAPEPKLQAIRSLHTNFTLLQGAVKKLETNLNACKDIISKIDSIVDKFGKLAQTAQTTEVKPQIEGLTPQINEFKSFLTQLQASMQNFNTQLELLQSFLPELEQPKKKRKKQSDSSSSMLAVLEGGVQLRGQSSSGVYQVLPQQVQRTLVALITLYKSCVPDDVYTKLKSVDLQYNMTESEQMFTHPPTQAVFQQARQWFQNVMLTTSRLYAVKYTDVKALQYIASQQQTAMLLLPITCPTSFKTRIANTFVDIQRVALLQALNDLIELKDCTGNLMQSANRQQLEQMVSQVVTESAVNIKLYSNSHINVLLTGAAGAGKTRYAQIIAKVMKNCGLLLSPSNIDVISRPDLVGQYLGQSAPRTKERLFQNLENVMFIDEAYSLAQGEIVNGKMVWESYSLEVMNEIVNFLDKYKGRICVIAAGYPQVMFDTFMKINEGMPRRFPFKILLPNYSAPELVALTCYFFKKNADLKPPFFEDKAACFLQAAILNFAATLFPNSAGDIENFASIAARFLQSKRRKLGSEQVALSVDDVINILLMYCQQAQNKLCRFTATPAQVASIAAAPFDSCVQNFQTLLQPGVSVLSASPPPAPVAPTGEQLYTYNLRFQDMSRRVVQPGPPVAASSSSSPPLMT